MSNDYDSTILNRWLSDDSRWKLPALYSEHQYNANSQAPQSISPHLNLHTPQDITVINRNVPPSGGDLTYPIQSAPAYQALTHDYFPSRIDQHITVSYRVSPLQSQISVLRPQPAHSVSYAMHNAQYWPLYETSGSPVVSLWSPSVIHRPTDFHTNATMEPNRYQSPHATGMIETPSLIATAAAGEWRPGNHMRRYQPFHARDMDTSVDSHMENCGTPCQKYTSVRALLLHWQDDGNLPGCTDEVRRLEFIFRENFGFWTTTFAIPEQDSVAEMMKCVYSFFHYSRSDELLIVFYAGHATKEPFHLSRYILFYPSAIFFLSRDETKPSINK